LRLIDSGITQLKAQGPSRTCNESKEEKKERSFLFARKREILGPVTRVKKKKMSGRRTCDTALTAMASEVSGHVRTGSWTGLPRGKRAPRARTQRAPHLRLSSSSSLLLLQVLDGP